MPPAFRIFARFMDMWTRIARLILRNRPLLLVVLGLATAFMAYRAAQVRMSYDGNRLIPLNDPDLQIYEEFRARFGIDGNVMVAGFQSDSLFTPELFQGLQLVTRRVKEVEGVKSVLSLANLPALVRDDNEQKFRLIPLVPDGPLNPAKLDSLRQVVHQTRLYEGIFIIPETNTTLLAIAFDGNVLDNKGRIGTVDGVLRRLDAFALNHGITIHYSGLPYVRTVFATRVADELKLFSIMALLMSGIMLFFFYRSFAPVFFPLLVVLLGAIWALGLISSLGYKITILSGLIPALVVVIGVPNCVYLLNKYHDEYRKHGNKIKALSRVVERVGVAALLTNTTTAIGFGVFYLTEATVLQEFGLVVALSVGVIFMISLLFIPIMFSFLPEPKTNHLKHLDRTALHTIVESVVRWVLGHRNALYVVFGSVSILAALGAMQLKARSRLVDDLPQRDRVMTDLKFFEENFAGVMPLEIPKTCRKPRKSNSFWQNTPNSPRQFRSFSS
jgi:predicted RND superfamily exporter protein